MLDEQVKLIGGLTTVTVKLQLLLFPQLSLAEANTVVVPIGNVLPLGGLAYTNGGGLQPPLADTAKKTCAPPGPVAVTTMFEGQVMLTTVLDCAGAVASSPGMNGIRKRNESRRVKECLVFTDCGLLKNV